MSYTRVDFQTDQEVRWCPGCGDYTILAAVQNFMAGLDIERENVVFVSGIGCAARFPYYMNTYGMHSIHGRGAGYRHRGGHRQPPAVGLGGGRRRRPAVDRRQPPDPRLAAQRGPHHPAVQQPDIRLTKGQYSPTSEPGKATKSSPAGSLDYPFNPVSLAIGAEATFVARTLDMDRNHTTSMLKAAHQHRGSSLIEIYQNCNVFNDKAFIALTGKQERRENRINLVHGEPIVFGADREKAVVWEEGRAVIVNRASVDPSRIIVHNAHAEDASQAFALSRLAHGPYGPTPLGIFRDVYRPVYDDALEDQVTRSKAARGNGDLGKLLTSLGTWTVE